MNNRRSFLSKLIYAPAAAAVIKSTDLNTNNTIVDFSYPVEFKNKRSAIDGRLVFRETETTKSGKLIQILAVVDTGCDELMHPNNIRTIADYISTLPVIQWQLRHGDNNIIWHRHKARFFQYKEELIPTTSRIIRSKVKTCIGTLTIELI